MIQVIITKLLAVMVPFSWEDDTGTTIRADAKRYAQAELTAAFQAQGQDFAPISVALLALVPTEGTSGNCVLFVDDMSAMQGYSGIVDNKPKWISTQLTNAQVTTIIAPVTTDQLNAMITSFVIAVTS